MVDRLKKRLGVEVLEDRTLPSTNPATLFVGGPAAAALQTNGDIVEVGQAATSPPGSSTAGLLALVRFTPDGQLDAGFGAGGEVWTTIKANPGETCGLSVQADGKIVLTVATAGTASVTVARFNADGSTDNSFAPDRTVSFSLNAVTDVLSNGGAAAIGDIVSLNAAGTYTITYTPPTTKSSSSASLPPVAVDLGQVGPLASQIPWTKGSDPGASGGSLPAGQGGLFLPARFAAFRGSDSHPSTGSLSTTIPTQLPWTRTSDSLLAWNDYVSAAEALASLRMTLVLLEGSDTSLSGGEGTVLPHRSSRPASLSTVEWPSCLHDSLIVPSISLAAPPPADVPPLDGPARTRRDNGLPAYLVRSVGAAVDFKGDADLIAANESPDAGLAAVDAALLLIGAGEKPVIDPETPLLASETREQQSQQQRGVSWPLWFVLLVAASGGGAAWQASAGGLPGLRRRRGAAADGVLR
jgi:uncharacterized delta-60 repeat protein